MKKIITGIVLLFVIVSCGKEMAEVFAGFQTPVHFPQPAYHFNTNNVTKDGFELGRKLFYDPILSADNSISCGTCHIQSAAACTPRVPGLG